MSNRQKPVLLVGPDCAENGRELSAINVGRGFLEHAGIDARRVLIVFDPLQLRGREGAAYFHHHTATAVLVDEAEARRCRPIDLPELHTLANAADTAPQGAAPRGRQRSEPEILADLIRLHDRNERRLVEESLPAGVPHTKTVVELREENDLIEQARAALHKYVVAAGKAAPPKRRPFSFFRRAS